MKKIVALMALALPMLLAACILSPGKFTSTLDIRKDRSFTFTYVGELIVPEDDKPAAPDSLDIDTESGKAAAKPDPAVRAKKMAALAEALGKEYGFRSVRPMGDDRLMVDYRISGRLDHGFAFPFNPDAEAVVPFVMIELRGADGVRIKAPGFGQSFAPSVAGPLGGGASSPANERIDGTFSLTTDGVIVSQNQEEGPQRQADGAARLNWRVTPLSKDAPAAVLRLNPLPQP